MPSEFIKQKTWDKTIDFDTQRSGYWFPRIYIPKDTKKQFELVINDLQANLMNEHHLGVDIFIWFADGSRTDVRIEVGLTGSGELHNIYI